MWKCYSFFCRKLAEKLEVSSTTFHISSIDSNRFLEFFDYPHLGTSLVLDIRFGMKDLKGKSWKSIFRIKYKVNLCSKCSNLGHGLQEIIFVIKNFRAKLKMTRNIEFLQFHQKDISFRCVKGNNLISKW